MRKLNTTVRILIILGLVGVVYSVYYRQTYSMEVVGNKDYNSPDLDQKLLIATQGSEFKNAITEKVVEHFKDPSIFIRVIDVSALSEIDPQGYEAILCIHTWEMWSPPDPVKDFIKKTEDYRDKIVILTTSGDGDYKMPEVDAITGESIMDDVKKRSDEIIKRIETILEGQ